VIPIHFKPDEPDLKIQKFWHLIEPIAGPCPRTNGIACANAQFMVTRECIRRNPLELYKSWYNKVIENNSMELPYFFEYTWHVIFGEQWIMNLQPFLPLVPGPIKLRPTVIQEMHIP
jgi:hypothetical protein